VTIQEGQDNKLEWRDKLILDLKQQMKTERVELKQIAEAEQKTHAIIVKQLKDGVAEHKELQVRIQKVMRTPRMYYQFRK